MFVTTQLDVDHNQVLPSLEQTVLSSDRSSLDSVPPVEHTVLVEDAPPSRSSHPSRSKASGVCSKGARSLSISKPRSKSRSLLRKARQLASSSSSLSGSSSESKEHPHISFDSESTSHITGSGADDDTPGNFFAMFSGTDLFHDPPTQYSPNLPCPMQESVGTIPEPVASQASEKSRFIARILRKLPLLLKGKNPVK